MFRIFILLLILASFLYSQQKTIPQIAVSDLIGLGINQSEANVVSEQLRAELLKAGHFRIVERSQMQEILKEQGFQQTGCTTDACAVQAGQLLGVRNIVVGTLGLAGSYTVLSVRIIDVQTGEVLVNETMQANGGVDKMVEGGIHEVAEKLVADFSNVMSKALIEIRMQYGKVAEVERLLQQGANGNVTDRNGATPLHNAAVSGRVDMAKVLLKYGADVKVKDNDGDTPLHTAASCDRVEIINVLFTYGADIMAKDNNGETPLHNAATFGNVDAVALLVKLGADVMAKDNFGGTPLYRAVSFDRADVIKFLIKLGADINVKDNLGMTPLYKAVSIDNETLIRLLVKCGANVNAKDNEGITPLLLAEIKGNTDVVEILKSYGAK